MKNLTAIALSGGVDSMVTAYLLKQKGHNLVGIHFYTGYGDQSENKLSEIAEKTGVDLKILDCSAEFKSRVIDYFIKAYVSGLTPNPCIVCNPLIKFGTVLSFAKKLGATSLATGHYARINKDDFGKYHLLRGIDKKKDQSYFLSRLTQEQLSFACFPLGNITKDEVKKIAAGKGLASLAGNESQDICFTENKTYGEFIAGQSQDKSRAGIIEDVTGNIIGEHQGLHLFTVGQRRGINCPASEPYYVIRIDIKRNRLVVGFRENIYSRELETENINWINNRPSAPIRVATQIRGRHIPAPSTLFPAGESKAKIIFDKPQSSITSGQGAVFYQGDEVIGGGWIAS